MPANPDPDSISEIYFRIPDFTKTSIPASAQFDSAAALRTLHLDSLRAVCGSYAITQQGGHWRGWLAATCLPGGIFDLFGTEPFAF